MQGIIRKIEEMKEFIEESKSKEAILQGRIEEAENQLKTLYGFTLKQAEEWLKKEKKHIEEKEKEIKIKFEELQESFPW